jgi:inorganic pyrophosphatase
MVDAAPSGMWEALDQLISSARLVIDRPKGSVHPRYPSMVYPYDYGYLEGTSAADGAGIDVWVGSLTGRALTALVITVDLVKRDAEIKLLLGCTQPEQDAILALCNDGPMAGMLIRRT